MWQCVCHVAAGCVLCALKRPEEAKEAFFAAIESSPQHVEVTPERSLTLTLYAATESATLL